MSDERASRRAALCAAFAALETPRLRLEIPQARHAAKIFAAYATDPEVTRYLSWPPARTQLDSDEAMKRRLARIAAGEEVSWIVVERRSDAVVAAIHVALDGDSGELGFAFARVFWGRGFASEAARAVAEWSLAPGRLSKLRATCDAENRASLRVLEKIGMRSQRLVAAHAVHPNIGPEARDCHVLSMDARDLERAVQLSRAGVE